MGKVKDICTGALATCAVIAAVSTAKEVANTGEVSISSAASVVLASAATVVTASTKRKN